MGFQAQHIIAQPKVLPNPKKKKNFESSISVGSND
jgi:hypothetical protein